MAKSNKKKKEKPTPKKPKKKGKYDITVKPPEGMTFEEMVRMAVNTPPQKKRKNK